MEAASECSSEGLPTFSFGTEPRVLPFLHSRNYSILGSLAISIRISQQNQIPYRIFFRGKICIQMAPQSGQEDLMAVVPYKTDYGMVRKAVYCVPVLYRHVFYPIFVPLGPVPAMVQYRTIPSYQIPILSKEFGLKFIG
jgi:hypothetical protein